MISSSEVEKAAREACLAGIPKNKNPYLGKQGFINSLKHGIWDRAFERTEREAAGV